MNSCNTDFLVTTIIGSLSALNLVIFLRMGPFDCPKRTYDETFEQLFGMWCQDLNKKIFFLLGIQMPGEGC